jgi:hypothetical protein
MPRLDFGREHRMCPGLPPASPQQPAVCPHVTKEGRCPRLFPTCSDEPSFSSDEYARVGV